MESSSRSGSKRRRLMVSYVSLRPDLPATFESLSDDPLTTILEFVGNKSYAVYAMINKHCKEVYLTTKGMTKETFVYGYAPLSIIQERCERSGELELHDRLFERVGKGVVFYNRSDVLEWVLEERNDRNLLNGICGVAAGEGRTDLLNKVWSNVNDEDDRRSVFRFADGYAASGGKLNVLKWYETKGLSITDKEYCAEAAGGHGHLHIMKWLREEKGLKLSGFLYNRSSKGGHFHVLKWLREQGCPWRRDNFWNAAWEENLEVLQWLHDEGCPWPRSNDNNRVSEEYLKPETLDWLRSNGYGDRIKS